MLFRIKYYIGVLLVLTCFFSEAQKGQWVTTTYLTQKASDSVEYRLSTTAFIDTTYYKDNKKSISYSKSRYEFEKIVNGKKRKLNLPIQPSRVDTFYNRLEIHYVSDSIFYFLSEDNMTYVGNDAAIYVSRDDCKTWKRLPYKEHHQLNMRKRSFFFDKDNAIYIKYLGKHNSKFEYSITNDGWKSWTTHYYVFEKKKNRVKIHYLGEVVPSADITKNPNVRINLFFKKKKPAIVAEADDFRYTQNGDIKMKLHFQDIKGHFVLGSKNFGKKFKLRK